MLNKALCLALLLRRKRKRAAGPVLGVVTVPRALPRLVPVPSSSGTIDYLFLHDLIEANAARMYRGYEVLSTAAFRVTRNSNLYFQEEETRSLLESMRPSCTTAAKATPCAWRSKRAPIPTSSSGCA